MKIAKRTSLALITLLLVFSTQGSASAPVLPNPILFFTGQEVYETGGKQFIRYRYDVAEQR